MRVSFLIASLLTVRAAQAEVTFVAPLAGAQPVGVQRMEIATDATRVDRVEFLVDGTLIGVARQAPYAMHFDFGTSLEPRTIQAHVFSAGYTRKESAVITTAAAGEIMKVDLVEVPLRVRSSRSLEAGDLTVRENGVPQTVREIHRARGAAHFAFVVDRSLSMTGGKLDVALAAVREAKTMLRADDTCSLILFNHHVSPAVLISSSAAREIPPPSGGTSLRDAVAATMSSGDAKRTYVIVITDGGDRNSILSDEEALRRISGAKSIVSAVTLGGRSPFLSRATQTTGGTLLSASKDNLRQQVRRIIEDIDGRYTLVYQSHGTGAGWRSVSVAPRRGGIEIVSARKGYFSE